jgi:hypothetical protein
MSQPDDIVGEVLAQRDAELRERVDRVLQDLQAMSIDLQQGQVVAARERLVAISIELTRMRRLLP